MLAMAPSTHAFTRPAFPLAPTHGQFVESKSCWSFVDIQFGLIPTQLAITVSQPFLWEFPYLDLLRLHGPVDAAFQATSCQCLTSSPQAQALARATPSPDSPLVPCQEAAPAAPLPQVLVCVVSILTAPCSDSMDNLKQASSDQGRGGGRLSTASSC